MKRLVVFLLLLGGGLMLLRWLQGPGTGDGQGGPVGPDDADWLQPEDAGRVPPGLTPRGGLRWTKFLETPVGSPPMTLRGRAADSGPEGDAGLWAGDVELEFFDVEAGGLRMRIRAGRATGRRDPSSPDIVPHFERTMSLRDAVVEVFAGAPIVPLLARVPSLELDFDTGTMRSTERVTIEGDGLQGSGTGLDASWLTERLAIENNGRIVFRHREQESATFRSTEPLSISREKNETGEQLVFTGRGGAVLEFVGEEDSLLRGEHIRVLASEREDEADPLVLRRVEASGNVRYRYGSNLFGGDRADVEFDEGGRPLVARIDGEPAASVQLEGLPTKLPGGGERGLPQITIQGSESMEVSWGELLTFEVGGPAVVASEEASLRSKGPVKGRSSADGASAWFAARGGVELSRGDALLATDALEVEIEIGEGGERVLTATAEGESLLTGTAEDGREFLLNTAGRLRYRLAGDRWTVPEANGMELIVRGDEGFRARADSVRAFDPLLLALEAEGNIEFESELGSGQGESLSVSSRESFLLLGSPEHKASFEGPEGRAEALRVERDGDRLLAEGEVRAAIRPSEGRDDLYDLAAEKLVLRRFETPDEDTGGIFRFFDLEVIGAVEGTVRNGEDGFEIECARLRGTREEWRDTEGGLTRANASLAATDVQRALLTRPDVRVRLSCDRFGARRSEQGPDGEVVEALAVAEGRVLFHGFSETRFSGTGAFLSLDHLGTTRLAAAAGERAFLSGELLSNRRPFEMEAEWIIYSDDHIQAHMPDIHVVSMDGKGEGEGERAIDIRARAVHMESTRNWLEFNEDVRVEGITGEEIPWLLRAQSVRFEGEAPGEKETGELSAMIARGGVVLELPGRGSRATGDELTARALVGTMRLTGMPARIETPVAHTEAEWVEFDVDLGFVVGTGAGRLLPSPPTEGDQEGGGWELEYFSSRTLIEPDSLIYILQEPKLRYPEQDLFLFLPKKDLGLRASWAVLWINRSRWEKLPQALRGELGPEDLARILDDPGRGQPGSARADIATAFARLRRSGINEIYLEGPVEASFDVTPGARADAVYLDVASGHGWLANATFTVRGSTLGQDFKTVKVKAEWLRQSEDGSLRADGATIALCEFDKPHVRIKTGDFRVIPNEQERGFEFQLRKNRVELYDHLTVPLPPLNWSADEEYRPEWASIQVGDSARFGSFVSAGFSRPADRVGEVVDDVLGGESLDIDAKYTVDASWLGSRGVLLDLGLELESKEQYWWALQLGGIPDSNEDRGHIRVDEDDRSTLRLWTRSRGRYVIDEHEWLDLRFSHQNDPGVQAEFFESDFLRFEQSENFLHWRKGRGDLYLDATLKKRFEGSRSDVEELPSAALFNGRSEVLSFGGVSLLYASDASAAYLQRREGSSRTVSPFGLPAPFPDLLEDANVLRFDTTQRLELPFRPGPLGLRATPFAEARFTTWSEDATRNTSPTRAFGQAGLRLSTTFWKPAAKGAVHLVTPFVQARSKLLLEENGGLPTRFDAVEDSLGGDFLDVGLRARLGAGRERNFLDLDALATHASSVPVGEPSGWRSIAVLSRLGVDPFGLPLEVFHDGRHDLEGRHTPYAWTGLALRLTEDLVFQGGHRRARDLDGNTLFEAASLAGRYTWTDKWEFEARQSVSLRDNDSLSSRVILRRYGHDVVFEIESSFRRGEGASFGINVRPLFAWRRRGMGYVDL